MKLNLNDKYYQKYIKYKNKYITLKKQNNNNDLEGGMFESLYNYFTTKPKSQSPQKNILLKLLEIIKTIILQISTENKFFLYKNINNIFAKNITTSEYYLNQNIQYYNFNDTYINNNLLQELEKLDMLDKFLLIKFFIKIKNKDINIQYSKKDLINLILIEKQLELEKFFLKPEIKKDNINKYNYAEQNEMKLINKKQLKKIFNELSSKTYHLKVFENILLKNLLNNLIHFNILELSKNIIYVITKNKEYNPSIIYELAIFLNNTNNLNNNIDKLFNIFDKIINQIN